jgi:excisionase family DNA binding protein
MARMQDDNSYLTVDDVAKRFGVDVSTVYRLVKRGKLPAFKLGSQWRISEARLEEWVADRERVG